jgi:coatomer subunit beta'
MTIFQVSWSTTGTLVAIASTDSLFLLRFDRDAYNARLDSGIEIGDEGVEEAFDLVTELPEK